MNPSEVIRKKRNRGTLSTQELGTFVNAYVRGDVADYQMSAFLMAVYFNGMSAEETTAFTDVMLHSGEVVDLSSIPGIKVDKHSTGGIGDKVSLILAPMVAACGVPVPMISGRGLGHTGGTLDKLEAIPGFSTNFSVADYKKIIAETGLVLIGQTKEIAPADKKMYGYLSEHHTYGMTEKKAADYSEDLAASMLASTLGISFDPETAWDEREKLFKMSGKFVRTINTTQTYEADKNGLWTSVIAAAVLILDK